MLFSELAEQLNLGLRPIVCFGKRIEEQEAYAEPGMRARIVKAEFIDFDSGVWCLTVDYTGFEVFNTQFESANYFDAQGIASLNAHQVGCYKAQEKIYFGTNETSDEVFFLEKESCTFLSEKFLKDIEKPVGQSYISWLEMQLLARL